MFFDAYSRGSGFTEDSGDGLYYRELIEAYLIDFDPVLDGCGPVFVELYAVVDEGDWRGFEVRQTASATANRLLVFRTESEALARAVYEGEPSPARLVRYSPAGMV